jgi:hypothetical protein
MSVDTIVPMPRVSCYASSPAKEKVQEMNRLFEEDRYEEITPEELASIKIAMVGGR